MSKTKLEIIPTEIIRTETALSRFPIHRLSKKGEISIDIKLKDNKGELKTKWKVSYNSEFGQPNPLAYKVDTIIINRKIEEVGKPVPKLIKLGSLKEIAKELRLGGDTNIVKKSLLQNAAAFISAKFTYKTIDGTERNTEVGDTRYAVIFTGEELPNGDKADGTYILLHDIYREILNSASTRPLDYEYLKELTPIAQRFYELLSYQMFAAVKNKRTAKMLYSEFCTYAPQTRFYDWEQVRPQMYRIHKPHLASGYIESFYYEKVRADDGTPDWLFIYTAGRKARGEYSFAMSNRRSLTRAKEIHRNPNQPPLIPDDPPPPLVPEVELTFTAEEEELISKMREFNVSESKARSLVKSHRKAVEREIPAFPYRLLGENVKNPSGLFIRAVEEGYEPPESYLKSLEQAEAKKRFQAEAKKHEREAKARIDEQKAWERASNRLANLPEAERQALFEATKKRIIEVDHKNADAPTLKVLESVIEGYTRATIIEQFIAEELETKS